MELDRPVRIVVPSRSLREHVGSALLRARGRAALGLSIQSLYGLACEVLERRGERPRAGEALFRVLVRQEARRQPELRVLERLRDGYGVVVASAADLLDAGLEPGETAALERVLPPPLLESGRRARAVVSVAARSLERLREAGLWRRSDVFARARDAIARDPELLPARSVHVYGFADATGVAGSLIERLVRDRDATVYHNAPPDPTDARSVDAGFAFGRAFRAQVGTRAATPRARAEPSDDVPETVELLAAPGSQAEVRAVASRIGRLLDAGVRPEGIGVVARSLDPYVAAVRLQLGRLGVPFSGLRDSGPVGPTGRRARALLELVQRGARATADRWLDAAVLDVRDAGEADLRLALRALGAARLADVARLPLERVLSDARSYALPVRRGIAASTETAEEDEAEPRLQRRHVPRVLLEGAIADAARLASCLDDWTGRAERTCAQHQSFLARVTGALRWEREDPAAATIRAQIERMGAELPPDLALRHDAFALLLGEELAPLSPTPTGGAGGGVQLLDVTEARGRTFEHLFVLGMNRDVFPRPVHDDPLLGDPVRRDVANRLPAIPIKELGHAEERFLFAELWSSSPHVTLSWQVMDDDDKARSRSSLVDRLCLTRDLPEPKSVPSLFAPPREDRTELRPAYEHAVIAGLYGRRSALAEVLEVALTECDLDSAIEPASLAESRVAVLEELDPSRAAGAKRLGPYFGFVGPAELALDPRHRPLYVTTLEGMAGCGWQTLLRRLLGVEPTPDPLAGLPGFTPLLIGAVVHGALEEIARPALGERPHDLSELALSDPVSVAWPEPDALDALLARAAEDAMREAGISLPGFARALEVLAKPYLERARTLDWAAGPVPVLGVEVTGSARAEDGSEILFRADRVDRVDGVLRLTDYKTGRAVSDAKSPEKRYEHLIAAIRSGEKLQAAAYALADGAADAAGRYLFLKPALESRLADVSLRTADGQASKSFHESVSNLLGGWSGGVFLPQLVEPHGGEPFRCSWCEVREACLQGDSGARQRLRLWLDEGTGG